LESNAATSFGRRIDLASTDTDLRGTLDPSHRLDDLPGVRRKG
jgi:hypothetical protein